MPANFQRYLPIMLLGLFLLVVLPSLLRKHSSGQSAKTQAAQTIDAVNLIDQAERSYRTAHGRFTPHISDLVQLRPRLATDLGAGLAVTLDAGADGQSYLQQVVGNYLNMVRARNAARVTASSCVVVKSASGVACPAS